MDTKKSSTPLILAIVMTALFIFSASFGLWAFIGMQENKSNLDAKIEIASSKAVEIAETAKEKDFAERLKSPYKTYTGPSTYGSITFDVPKNWSMYAQEATSGTLLDFYAQPNLIPGISKGVVFAFHAEIRDSSYEQEIKKLESSVKSGKLKIKAFRPEKVKSALGIVAEGEVSSGTTGTMVLLPLRDKTYVLTTESSEYLNEFTNIIKSLSFIP